MKYTIRCIRKTFSTKVFLVAAFWLFGLVAGVWFINLTSFSSLMYSVYYPRISIIGLIFSLAIPFIISYILLRFFNFYFILPIIFSKAFSFICSYGAIMIAYGNAGWLVSGMLLFSDFFVVVLLLFVWYYSATGECCNPRRQATLYVLIPTLIGCYDYFVVSPYVAMLLNY